MSKVEGDEALFLYIGKITHNVEDNVSREIYNIMADLKTYVKNNKLSGQALNVVTGNLRNSVKDSLISARDTITGQLEATGISAKGFPYGYIHEYNLGRYKDTKDHSYMRTSLAENLPNIEIRIKSAIEKAIYDK